MELFRDPDITFFSGELIVMVSGASTAIASNIRVPKYFRVTTKQLSEKRVLSGMGFVRDGLCLPIAQLSEKAIPQKTPRETTSTTPREIRSYIIA